MPDRRPPKYKTCRRENEPGDAHALTFSCFRRLPLLTRERSCRWVLEAIERARERHRFHLWAYVIMPEHVHMLIFPLEREYDVSAMLNSLKKSVANRALSYLRQHAPAFLEHLRDQQPSGRVSYRFWQRGGGYDRNLHSSKYVWEMIDYIHRNPVTRGLCELPEKWPWSSARAYVEDVHKPLKLDLDSLPDPPPHRV